MTDVLYGARGGNQTTSDLYTLDPDTGAPSSIGPIGFAVTGLAFDPTNGTLYGVTNNNSASNPRSLITIDRLTGAGTIVGPLGLPGGGFANCSDIAFTPAGQLYGWGTVFAPGDQLVQINKATGAGTYVGSPPGTDFGGGLDVSPIDLLMYRIKGHNVDISTVDLATSLQTSTGVTADNTNVWNAFPFAAAKFDNSGVLWVVGTASVIDGTGHLGVVNMETGVLTDIGHTIGVTFNDGIDAIAWRLAGPVFTVAATPVSGDPPLDVAFTATVVTGTVLSWEWDFGDGGTSTDQNPSHTFGAGTYTVVVVAHGPDGDTTRSIVITVTRAGSPLLPPCGSGLDPLAFFGAPWRSVVTDLDGGIVTLLDRRASERVIETALGAPAQSSGQVPSEDPEINILHTDGYPFLNESNRLLWMFRREGTPTCWVPRFAGPIMSVQDQAGPDRAVTSYTAFDSWQLLRRKPLVDPQTGDLPDADGVVIKNMDCAFAIIELLNNMWLYLIGAGDPHPEAHLDWGQTGFWNGTMEHTGTLTWVEFGQTTSVGDALTQIVELGLCDIVIKPIWDPVNRPGITGEVNVYTPMAGTHRNAAIMAWDKPSRSLAAADALYDGNSLLNEARYSAAQGPSRPLYSNAGSVARYGSYWEQSMFAGENSHREADASALREVGFRKDGKVTYEVTPIAGRSPIPFVEYDLGDQVPVWASDRIRRPLGPRLHSGVWEEMARIYGIRVELSNEDVERVTKLRLSRGDF